MKNQNKAIIAYIAGKNLLNVKNHSIYDNLLKTNILIEGIVNNSKVNVSIKDSNFNLFGEFETTKIKLYNKNNNSCIELEFYGDKFIGMDNCSGFPYEGKLEGDIISLYDYEDGKNCKYSFMD